MTLPFGMLQKVTTIVSRENSVGNPCPDGRASAILAADYLPNAKVVFAAHNDPAYENMEAKSGMLFVDMIPPPKRTNEFVDVGAMVLDHHVTHKETVAEYGPLGVYSDEPGVSGALLTYRNVWQPLSSAFACVKGEEERALDFATLAGIRDTWQRQHKRWYESCEQAEALRFYPWSHFCYRHPFRGGLLNAYLEIGKLLIQKQSIVIGVYVNEAAHFQSKIGTRVAVIPTTQTSDVAEHLDVDVLVGFKYVFNNTPGVERRIGLVLSFRSRGNYDVGQMAVALGGGGHKNAAGCLIDGEDSDPYTAIAKIIDLHELVKAEVEA